ncbi:type-F conjugative transfer system secretin TraK [Candidatus Fukatsuia endosymbiont of Tuberolachnus salignus]|uniref:type-F conjugative transfer system secretin TraK n=1 Tax=Candidatus Fukatsuia endosymbiont of Tuberolachnus salignus TaxID=3077957 RepID=UPI00313CC88A
MRKNNLLFVVIIAIGLCFFTTAKAVTALQAVALPADGQFQLAISNNNPNLIGVLGDRIVAINSAAGMLTDKRNTVDGAVLFSSLSEKPFTLYIETEHEQVFSVQATPSQGAGRRYRLLGEQPVGRPAAKAWETAQPYGSLLVELNKAALRGNMPERYAQADLTQARALAPLGLTMTAEQAWVGDALRVIRYQVRNPNTYSIHLTEQDFWRPGIRAVMFTQPVNRLLPGAAFSLYITTDRE